MDKPRGLIGQYIRSNLKSAMEYRVSFLIQVFGMALNNLSFILFWGILFYRKGNIAGYEFVNILFLWSMVTTGYGLATTFLGNFVHLSRIIYNGELDVYLLQPRNVIVNLLSSRMNVSGWGELLFGIVLYLATQPLDPFHIVLYLFFSMMCGLGIAAVVTAFQSLSFYIGRAEEVTNLVLNGLLSFLTYPSGLFTGGIKWILMTLMPAFWLAYIPEEIFRSFSWEKLLFLTAVDILIIGVCVGFFYLGLRKYESGNRMGTRL